MKLSIVIPVFDEVQTIAEVLRMAIVPHRIVRRPDTVAPAHALDQA
jgi:hypothetical protein